MAQKKGMEFFKKLGGAEGKPSILSGMKIKANKESKPVAQTETNLNFASKKQEEVKPEASSRDDIDIKKPSSPSYQPIAETKEPEVDFRRDSSKSSENKPKVQKVPTPPQTIEEDRVDSNQATEPVSATHKNLVETKSYDHEESRSSKSYKHTTEVQAAKNQHSPRSTRPEPKEKKVEVPERKKSDKPLNLKKSEESFSAGRRPSVTREPQKPKKSDREQVLDEINEFTVKLAKIIVVQREVKMQIAQSKASIKDTREQVSRWTSEQAICAEKQDYEEADRLQQSIEGGEKKIQQLQIELAYLQSQVIKQQNEQFELLKTQNSNMKRLSRKLKLVQLQLQDEAADIKRTELEKIETLKTKQESERKKIMRIEKDIAYQSEQISQFEKQFNREQEIKVNPLKDHRQDLESNKNTLEAEIKELERKLKEKKASLVEVVKQLKSVNQTISDIEESFKEESVKLQQRKNKLEMVENERDEIQLTISDIDNSIQLQTKAMDAKFNQKINEANQLAQLAKNIEQKQMTFEDEVEARRAALDSFLLNANSLKEFENLHRAEKERIKEIQYKKSTVSGQISKLQERREQLKKKIPVLQIQQKKFVDQKNFKAAGITKNEIKEINAELSQIKERLDDYLGEQHGLEIEYEQICSAQKEANDQEALLQKNLAYSQVKFDAEKLKKLEEYLTDLQKASGMPSKEKQKLLRELASEIVRLKEQIKYLSSHFELASSPLKQKAGAQKEQHEELDNNDEHELQENQNEGQELMPAQTQQVELSKQEQQHSEEDRRYEPLDLGGQEQPEELEDNEDGGYVPLQLDD